MKQGHCKTYLPRKHREVRSNEFLEEKKNIKTKWTGERNMKNMDVLKKYIYSTAYCISAKNKNISNKTFQGWKKSASSPVINDTKQK